MIRKGTLMHCYHVIFTPCWNFANCPNNIVYSQRIQFKTTHCIWLSCVRHPGTVSSLSWTSRTLTLLKITGQLFLSDPGLDLSDVFSWVVSSYTSWAGMLHKCLCVLLRASYQVLHDCNVSHE